MEVKYYGTLSTEFGTRVVANLLERCWIRVLSDSGSPVDVVLCSPPGADPYEAECEIRKAEMESVRP